MIAKSAVIYPNVTLGENITIEDFCIIGAQFQGYRDQPTIIGDNALIRSGTVIYAGNEIGNNFQSGNNTNIRELNKLGDDVSIGTHSVLEHHLKIGNGVRVHSQVFIPEFSTLEDECWLGPNVVITNAKFPKHPEVKDNLHGVRVCYNAKIGANSTLLPGVVVGANSLVGAGSVVTRDVLEGVIVAGNPARLIRRIEY